MAKVRHQYKLNLSKSKGSVISTQRVDVTLGQNNSLASWKRSGLLELDPKGKGDRGYDGTKVFQTLFYWLPMHCLPDHISTSVEITIPVDYRLSTQFELIVFMAEVFYKFTSSQVAHSNAQLSCLGWGGEQGFPDIQSRTLSSTSSQY